MKTITLMYVSLCSAVIAILAQITIPFPLVPITGQTLAIGLVATLLGRKYGTISVLLYILLGMIGLPVFQAFSGGLGIILGPTGGYIIGFLPTVYIIGLYLEKTSLTIFHAIIANILGMFFTLAFGTTWLKFVANLNWSEAILSGAAPFILPGIIKAILAAYLGIILYKRMLAAKLLQKTL